MKKNERLLDAIGNISKDYVNEAGPGNTRVITHKKNNLKKFGIAACAVIALAFPVRYLAMPYLSSLYGRSALSNVGVSDIIKLTKPGYEMDWTYGFTGDVTITDREGNKNTVLNGFSNLYKSYEDFDKVCDGYYCNDVLFTISANQMTVTARGKTKVTERKFGAGSRILGYDNAGNFYVLCVNDVDGTAELQKYSISGELINQEACSRDIPLNECIGFDSITVYGEHGVVLSDDNKEESVLIEYTDDGNVEISVKAPESVQTISTTDDGQLPEYIDGDSIFTMDETTKIFSDESGEHRISVDLTYSETRKEFNRQQGTSALDFLQSHEKGYSCEMGIGFNNIEYLVLILGNVGDKIVLNKESAANEGITESQTDKINSVLQTIVTDADGGAGYVGGDSETGYIMVPGPEFGIDFYSFEMKGDSIEKIGSVFFNIDDKYFGKVKDFSLGDSVYYNGACYGVIEFVMEDDAILRFICTCDNDGKTGYAEISPDYAAADDVLTISDRKVGFMRTDGSFYSADFVYDSAE